MSNDPMLRSVVSSCSTIVQEDRDMSRVNNWSRFSYVQLIGARRRKMGGVGSLGTYIDGGQEGG